MNMSDKTSDTVIGWSEVIVVFNSLIRNIEFLRVAITSGSLDDDELYDAEEELKDYEILLAKLRQRYTEIAEKGELSGKLLKKLKEIV